MTGDPVAAALSLMITMLQGGDTDAIEGQLDREAALHVAVALAGNLVACWQAIGLDPLATAEGILHTHRAAQN